MKRLILLSFLIMLSNFVNAKPWNITFPDSVKTALSDNGSDSLVKGTKSKTFRVDKGLLLHDDNDVVFTYAEKMPAFPGGTNALKDFFKKNLVYPVLAREAGIEGKVFVKFTVSRTGKVYDIAIAKGIGGGCDEEAMRLVKLFPAWIPGEEGGRKVLVSVIVPVIFKLE